MISINWHDDINFRPYSSALPPTSRDSAIPTWFQVGSHDDGLPRASVCSQSLYLPAYPDAAALRARMGEALLQTRALRYTAA